MAPIIITERNYTVFTNWAMKLAVLVVAFCVTVPIINTLTKVTTEPPIVNNAPSVVWIDEDTMMLETHPGGRNTTSCPELLIDRWLETTKGRWPVEVEILNGPYRTMGLQKTQTVIRDLKEGTRIPTIALIHRPKELKREEILGYSVNQTVTQDKPCSNGWWGTAKLTRVSVR